MRRLIIVGAGGTGQDVAGFIADINEAGPTYECLGFLDDAPDKQGTDVCGYPVLGPLASAADHGDVAFADCLGSPASYRRRRDLVTRAGIDEESLATIIHPTAIVAAGTAVGRGCILYPFTHVGPGVELGREVIVLSHSVIHHHSRVGSFSIIASGCSVSGHVDVGEACYLGAGCSVRDGIRIGAGSLVGMGSAVVTDVQTDSVVAGVPARYLRPAG